ncbi:MAG TPA: rRNA maturation RNase YbeY [Bacteriovoracaceae bacterium]|nr:rRNA maturation RNase YbeY [Bacteriovoracaceae bacterium]
MASMKKHPFLQVEYQSTVKLSPADEQKLKLWLSHASQVAEKLASEGLTPKKITSLKVSLLICGDTRIKVLNRDHRNKDKVTDVLSFPSNEPFVFGPFLGDMAICMPQAKRQAKEFKIGIWDEFIHLFFHGLLHLIGYDHEISLAEEKKMQKWEDRALELFSKKRKGA